jgi:hypothetical protein
VGAWWPDHDDLGQPDLPALVPCTGNALVPVAVTWVSIDSRHGRPRYEAEVNVP